MSIRFNRLHFLLSGTCILLSGGLGLELAHPIWPPSEALAPKGAQLDPNPVAATSLQISVPDERDFSEISQRPVFNSTRRPAPPPSAKPPSVSAPTPPPPPPRVNVTLIGVVTEPDRNLALLKLENNASAVVVSEGQSVNGWEVSRILADRVVLKNSATEEEVLFPKPSSGASSSAGAHAPPLVVTPKPFATGR